MEYYKTNQIQQNYIAFDYVTDTYKSIQYDSNKYAFFHI